METKATATGLPIPTATVGGEPEKKSSAEKKESLGRRFTFAALDTVKKMLAPLASLGVKLPIVEALDDQGYLKEAEAKKAAAEEAGKKLTQYLERPELKKLDPQGKEKKQKIADFLQAETQFPLLPPAEQGAFLKAQSVSDAATHLKQNWMVHHRFAHAFKIEADQRLTSDPKTACKLYDMALQWDPDNGGLHYQAAWALNFRVSSETDPKEAAQAYNEALRHLHVATAKDPKDFFAWRMAGQILVKAGRAEDAPAVFSEALIAGKAAGASAEDIKSLEGEKKAAEEKAQPMWSRELSARPAELSKTFVLIGQHSPALSLEECGKHLTGKDVTQTSYVTENPAADRLAALMKKAGIAPGEVKPFKDPKEVKSGDYLNYAFANYPKFQKEIQECFGKLPFKKEEQPDPTLVTQLFDFNSAETKSLMARHKQLKAKVEGNKTDANHPDLKLFEMYDRLLLSSKGTLQQKAGLYLAIQGEEAKTKAKEARLTLFQPSDAKKVETGYAQAGECYDKAFALGGDPKDAKAAAENFYSAAAFAPKGEAKMFYLKGVSSLQKLRLLPSDTSASALEKDSGALKLMGLGFQSAGLYKEAIQAFDLAFVAGDKSPALSGSIEANKKHLAAYEKLGDGFHARIKELESREKAGKLGETESKELKAMRSGLVLIERCNEISLPLTKSPAEPPVVAKVRDQVVASLKIPLDMKKVEAAEALVKRLEAAETSLKKMESERAKVVGQAFKDAPYVGAYLDKTGDYSWLRLDYGGLKAGDEWNAEVLHKLPSLQAYRELQKKDPAAAKQIEAVFQVFQEPKLVAGLDKIDSLEALEKVVGAAEAKVFKTDASGTLPQKTDPVTGEKSKIFETHPAFGVWAVEAEKIELNTNPAAFMRNALGKNQESVKAIAKALPELEKAAQDLKTVETKLAAAKQAGNAADTEALQKKAAEIKKNLGALKEFLAAQAADFEKDAAIYQKHAEKLGVLEKDGSVPFGKEMAAAKLNVEKLKKQLAEIDIAKDPQQALATLTTHFKVLGGSQKIFLKSLAFADAAMVNGWRSSNPDMAMSGSVSSNLMDTGGQLKPDAMWSLKNETMGLQWDLEKSKLNQAFGDRDFTNVEIQADRDQHGGFAFLADAPALEGRLQATESYLKKNDQQMFKTLQTTLSEGLEFEIEKWSQARSQMAERGDSTKEIDKLIDKYFQAKFALRDGDTKRALALYREALDSKRSNVVFKQYEESNKKQMYRTMVLEVAIISAATLLTAGTMSAFAASSAAVVEAGAAMEVGAATIGQQALMLGLESAAFVGWDKAIHYGLHKGTGLVEDPFRGARDLQGNLKLDLLAADLTFDVVKNMGLFKSLRTAGEFYQTLAVGRKILANPAAKGLVEEAAKISSTHGKVIFKQLLEIEMANMSKFGKVVFKAGSFATEAGAMQTWNNLALILEVPYQNAVHGKKLEFSAEFKNVNSLESVEHGLLQLIGLKLGGFGTHPLAAEIASGKTQQAAQSLKIKRFGELREGLAQDLAQDLAAPASRFDPKLKARISEFLKLGDHIYAAGDKSGALPPEVLEEWKEVRTTLDAVLKVEAQLKDLVEKTKAASDQLQADMKTVVDGAKAESQVAPVGEKPAAKVPASQGLPPIVEAQVQKAKKLAALGVKRGLVDKNAAARLPRELESYLRLFMAEAERTLDAQRPSPEQQKKLIPELAKKNAENFVRRFAEELGLKQEASFQKKLESLLHESLEKVATHHNERLPSFPLASTPAAAKPTPAKAAPAKVAPAKPSSAKPAPTKPKRADQAEIAAGLEQFSKDLQVKTEQWLAAKEKGGKTVSREAFLQQQCEAAFQLAERLGVAGDPAFRKGLAEMVVGLIRRAEAHAPAGEWLPDSMAAYAKKAPAEKPAAAAKSESPKSASEAAPAKKKGGLDIDQVVVEVSLLAKEFKGDPVAFKKELARVLITGFHELQKWVAKDSPGALEIGERVQFVSEALAKKLAAHFGVAKDAAFVKKIEGMLRSQLKEALVGKAAGSDTIIRPPDFSEAKAPLQVDSLFPEAPAEKLPSRGDFLRGLEAGLRKLEEAAQGPMKKSLEKKAHEEGLFSGAFGGEAKADSGPEVIVRNLRKLHVGLKKRLLDFVYDKVQKFEASGKKELGAQDKAKLAEEVIRFAEEFGLAHEPAFTEPLKQLVSEGMTAAAKGFSESAPAAVPKPGAVAKQFDKLRRSFLDKLFEARGELEVPPDGKVGISKPRAFAVEPVKRASAKLDAVFSMLEKRMLEHPSSEIAKAAEAIGRDVDVLVKEDPAKVGPEYETQVSAEKAAAVARLERLLRGIEMNPDWAADHLAAEYGKPFTGQAELEAAYASSAEAAHGERYGELLADVCSRRDAKVPPFHQLAKLTLEELSLHPVGSEKFRDFLDRYAMVRDLEIEKSGAATPAEAPKLPGFFDDIPLAAHGSSLGKSGHSSPDTVQTPPPSLSGVKAKEPAPESISLDWAANDTMASAAKPKSVGILAPLPEAVPEATWAPAPAEASSIPDGSVAGIANPARKVEIAKAWVAAYENPKSPLYGDPDYQASYQAAKAYLSAVESGKAPPEAGFVADYHVPVKDGKVSGVLAFADPSQPLEKTWEVAGQDGQGRWQLKNLKTGETRSFQVLFQDKPAFLKGDRLRFLPMVAGASDGPLRPLRPAAEGQALWIGRDPAQANVVVSEDFVSRLHCSIEHSPEGWYVADRHSTNGVYVNGAKVEGSAWLKSGDVLSTKDKHGQFHLLGVFQAPAASPAPAPKLPAKPSGNAGLFGDSAPILHGDVDLKAPPVHRLKPDAGSGEVAAVTTQGAGYGKKNEDNVLVMRGKGGLLMLDVDGMGGEGHGDVAALLTAEAFKVEMHRSGDEGQAWALANKTVRRFNAELHHLTGGKAKWAKPEQVQQALAAARAGISDPAAPLPEQGGAGAVAVAVRVHPPKHPGEAHRAEFSWVGDARAMILERGADGKWRWVFRTVDEGLPAVPGMLRPGEDYEFGGARKTLAGALHPMANIVTNSVGKEGAVAVKKTSDGEFPAPGTATGAKEAGKAYEAGVSLKPGQMILAGSDGFWENFGSTREVLDLIQFCKTAEQAREVLTHEAHRRMEILAEARDWLENPAANPKRLERFPFEHHGKKQFIDAKGRVFDAPTGGKAVNHFKTDNFSLIAYLHTPAAAAASAAPHAEPLPAAAHAKAGPHPVKMMAMVPGNIPGLRKVDHAWFYMMPKGAAEVVLGRDAFPASQETAGVSAKHVRLIRSAGSVFVQDMGSLNGMKVLRDGKEVFAWKSHNRTPGPTFAVHPGDQIVMEGTAVHFFGSE
ncbi:MAG: FHA domain-containing protein [Deltaproteobacteria bacterium]|nr:FHA domain-containing protein [Deltaproteobacteria bacterium]